MATETSDITLFRIDPARNMRRYYSMTIQPNLFGGYSLMREWGRIGFGGRRRIDLFEDEQSAKGARIRVLRKKRNRGYRP